MRLIGAIATVLVASPAALASTPLHGPWCDEAGEVVLDITLQAIFLPPQTRCDLPDTMIEQGVFEGEVPCETALFLGADQSTPEIVQSLMRLRVQYAPGDPLTVQLDERNVEELMHCHAVWPL